MFRDDVTVGLTVAVMLVPQSMAYAALAGMPPVTGLYASIVPLVVYALLARPVRRRSVRWRSPR